jgi:hypothetical protein
MAIRTSQLLPIPAGLSNDQLANAINDRLRRITPTTTATVTTEATSSALSLVTVSTSPYSIPSTVDLVIFVSGSGTATLPAAAGFTRRPLWLINASSGNVTLNSSGSDTVASAASMTLYAGGRYQLIPTN